MDLTMDSVNLGCQSSLFALQIKKRQNMPSLQAKQLERLIKFDQCLRI